MSQQVGIDVLLTFQDVEIKKMGGSATYGFILYYDLMSAVNAKQYMDGHDLKGNKLRVSEGCKCVKRDLLSMNG
jgi:hypothetical protein